LHKNTIFGLKKKVEVHYLIISALDTTRTGYRLLGYLLQSYQRNE